jgi:UDP-N-acetylglucosamine 4-epimerase
MNFIDEIEAGLRARPRSFLVTGAAGFIGSHLVERLLSLGQRVVALDSFVTGKRENIQQVLAGAPAGSSDRFRLLEADTRDPAACAEGCRGVDVVLHQAALGSVPRSIADPLATHQANVDGTLQLLIAARDAKVGRFVYASSSSVYGDHPDLPKVEDRIGNPLSPYALSKRAGELYAGVFAACYGFESIGLRYFNVFGRRQDPQGAYAAALPRWTAALIEGRPAVIFGDGETSRDFCHVSNVVQANLLAASAGPSAVNQVYNVACGERTTLRELFSLLRAEISRFQPAVASRDPEFQPARAGDIRHSLADVSKARRMLGYEVLRTVRAGLEETVPWYVEKARQA